MKNSARLAPLILLLSLTAALQGCSEPTSRECWCRRAPFEFALEFADTAALYDISFYAPAKSPFKPVRPVQLEVEWMSPDSARFTETVWFTPAVPARSSETASPVGPRFCSNNAACSVYRSGLSVPEAGEWTLTVTPASEWNGGLGIICTKR